MIGAAKKTRFQLAVVGLSFSCSTVAMAQVNQIPLPPIRSQVDSNGVNLALGQVEIDANEVAIGNSESGLSFSRHWDSKGWRNDFQATISYDSSGVYSVTIGGSRRTFDVSIGSNIYTARQFDGSKLEKNSQFYIFTDPNGVK